MSNPKPDFPAVIKNNIPSITNHPKNIGHSSKRDTNQSRITFQQNISKPHLLSFLHSMYNPIKLSNQSSLNLKKRRENSNKFPHTPMKNTSISSKIKKLPSNRKKTKNFTSTSISTKKLDHIEIQHIILH